MQSANTPMTPRQVALVQESFAKIVPIGEQAAALFYDRLFAIDPSTRPLFRGDMKSQGAKLMAAIGAVVKSLDRIDTMLDDLRTLARRHHRYGVREEHCASVGAALLWMLEQGLGFDFTPDVREAWATAYDLLSGDMIAVSSDKDPTIPTVALRLDWQHSAGPELLRGALTAAKSGDA
jgi:hemoglobin-like flavoprotein